MAPKMVTRLLLLSLVLNVYAFSDALKESYQLEYNKKFQEAFLVIQKQADGESKNYFAHLRTAYLAYILGNTAASIKYYNNAIAIAPDAIEPGLGLLLPQIAAGNYTQAEATAKAILLKDNKNYTARSRLAWAYYLSGRYSDASKYYESLVKDYPSDTTMQVGLADSLFAQGKKTDALKYYQMIDSIIPGDARAAFGISLCNKK